MSGYKNSITDINGKIGIGVSNPSATLDVAGNATVTGDVAADGKILIGGSILASSSAKLQVQGFMRTGPIMIANGTTANSVFDDVNEKWITNNAGTLTIGPGNAHGDAILHAGNFTGYTDPKYLRSNADDTATGTITFENGIKIGTGTFGTSANRASIVFGEGSPTSNSMYIEYDGEGLSSDANSLFIGRFDTVSDIARFTLGGDVILTSNNWSATSDGTITATSFVKSGGNSSQFLKADGSVDSSEYLTDITTQTDPKYLRSNADDTTSGSLTITGSAVVGTNGTIRLNQYDNGFFGAGEVLLTAIGGTGWNTGDTLGRIRFYTNDASGIGARDVAKIEAVSETGNGTTTTTSSAALSFYTSLQNANVVENMRLSSAGNLSVVGTISSGGNLSVSGTISSTGDFTAGGNIKGPNLQISSTTPTIYFNGTADGGDYATSDMAIKATPEGLDFYEPEDGNKIHFQILDDLGVNSPFGYQWNGQSLDSRYLRKDVATRGVGLTIAPTTTDGNGKIRTLFNGGSPALEFSDNAGTISADQFFAIGANDVGIGKFEIRFKSTEFSSAWETEGTLLAEFKADNNAVSFPQGLVGIGTTDFGTTAAKLLVGSYIDSGSAAIAQFDGFLRIKDQIIIHDPVTTSAQGILAHTSAYGMYYSGSGGGSNFGIGTTTPSYKLDVSGNGRFTTNLDVGNYVQANGYINTSNNFERVVSAIVFPDGVANQAADIRLGNLSFWGYIEVEITSTFSNQNSAGKLTKTYSVGTNPSNLIYVNESRVVDAMGTIADNVSLGEFEWDSAISQYRIPVSHIVSTGNNYTVKIRMFTHGGGAVNVFGSISLSAVYTRTAFSKNYVNYNDRVGIGTKNPFSRLHIASPDPSTDFNLIDFRNIGGYGIYAKTNSISSRGQTLEFMAVDYNTGGTVLTRESLCLRPEGNVGIGIASPSTKLHVVGGDFRLDNGVGDGYIEDSNGNSRFYWGTGTYVNSPSTSGLIAMSVGGSVRLTINSDGNVGIGKTTGIDYKLDVVGESRFYNSATNANSYLRIQNNRARNAGVYTQTTNGGFYAGTSIGTDTFCYNIYDGVAGVSRVTISSDGNFIVNGSGHIEMQESHFINKRFDLDGVDGVSPAYVILCQNAANNDVNGSITMDRTSGLRTALKVDIIVSAGASLGPVGGLRAFGTSGAGNPSFRLVTCTYSGVSYIALEIYTPDGYYETSGAYFTGRLVSTGISLVPVAAASVTSVATFEANTAHYFDGETYTTGSGTIQNDLFLGRYIYHNGDTNTYIGFQSNDNFRVVTGGTERFNANDSYVNVNDRLSISTTNFGTSAAKLLVGDYLNAGSSAIAQFNGFLRVRDQIILHSDGDTSLEGYFQCTAAGTITTGGTFRALGDVIAYASSDRELKDNVKPITNAIDKVKAIGGYEFDWNDKQEIYEGHDVGVIAQEIEAVLPEVVTTRENGYKAVKYEKIVPLLIEAIKEQQKQIDELKAMINGSTK